MSQSGTCEVRFAGRDNESDDFVAAYTPNVVDYKERLNKDRRLAMSVAGGFEKRNLVVDMLYRITWKLEDLRVPYAVITDFVVYSGRSVFRRAVR